RAEIAAIRAYAAARREDVGTAMEQSQKALALLPEDDYMLRGVVLFVQGGLFLLEDDIEKALDAWKDASTYGEKSGNIHLAVSALNSVAGLLAETGKVIEAEEIYTRALGLGTSHSGVSLSFNASIYAGLARLYLAQKDFQKAKEFAQTGFELGQQWLNPDSQIGSLLTLAQVAQLEGDPDEAQRLLDEVTRIASTRDLMPGTDAYIERAKIQIQSQLAGKIEGNSLLEPLSERELEVLRMLADGCSNPEIAEALIIALGTVKAHTSTIYRKLEVKNRTQAVIRARELKII
ncbi:MAG: tetratricopeptide repeat protein, partial [Anaerolineales bacterium]